jgi:gamma-glutamyltranspeptidase/glutathione hydrolase
LEVVKRLREIKLLPYVVGALACSILVAVFAFPARAKQQVVFEDPHKVKRSSVASSNGMAATGTPWATEAALKILEKGGNAFDAGMAALLALNVTYPEAASFPSVAPTIIYDAEKNEVWSYCGAGAAPKRATIEFFRQEGYETIPNMGILAQLVPSSPDALIAILDKYGTMSFSQVSEDAIRLAAEGFPVHSMMLNHLDLSIVERAGFRFLMPYNAKIYLNGHWWRPLKHKELFRQPDLARTLQAMADTEAKALEGGANRSQGLQAVRDYFYRGPIADAIARLHEEKGGLMTKEDLESYSGYWERPLTGSFGEYTIHVNQTWNQGAVLPMTLQILEGIDLKSMGHNSPEYLHTVIQAVELSMADREAYFGDPAFVDVPIEGLLDKKYAAARRQATTPGKAFGQMPVPGDVSPFSKDAMPGAICPQPVEISEAGRTEQGIMPGIDTSYLAVTDARGNSISLTPSDFPQSPMVPGTGLCLGIRMTQFRLDPAHPAALEPGKRPRITPNACMVTRNGKLFMTFGTPEGDQQPQALVQVFLNLLVFGMDIQDAIDAPRFRSRNFPDSFSPHQYRPGVVNLEKKLYEQVGEDLQAMGYKVEAVDDWYYQMGAVCAIIKDDPAGALIGGADPRQENWAAGR